MSETSSVSAAIHPESRLQLHDTSIACVCYHCITSFSLGGCNFHWAGCGNVQDEVNTGQQHSINKQENMDLTASTVSCAEQSLPASQHMTVLDTAVKRSQELPCGKSSAPETVLSIRVRSCINAHPRCALPCNCLNRVGESSSEASLNKRPCSARHLGQATMPPG